MYSMLVGQSVRVWKLTAAITDGKPSCTEHPQPRLGPWTAPNNSLLHILLVALLICLQT